MTLTFRAIIGCILFISQVCFGAGYYNSSFGFRNGPPRLVFTTSSQSRPAYACSGVVTLRNVRGNNVPSNVSSNLTLNLTASPGVSYFSDSNCVQPITTVTIAAGTNTTSFYYLGTTASSISVQASATDYLPVAQSHTITANNYIWTGLGADANWSTALNWSGGSAPTSSHYAVFNSSCSSNCSPVVASNMSVNGIRFHDGYSGTLTQNSSVTMTIGSGGFIMKSGAVMGSDANISVSGPFVMTGGSFTSTTATLNLASDFLIYNSPTFDPRSGTVSLNRGNGTYTFSPGSLEFNHVSFSGYGTTHVINGTLVVNGSLSASDTYYTSGRFETGTILAKGNVSFLNYGLRGTAKLVLGGSSNQSLSAAATALIPNIEIASTGGTVSLVGSLIFMGNFTYTSGTVDASASSVQWGNGDANLSVALNTGSVPFNDVTFFGFGSTYTLTGSMIINGNLTLGDDYYSSGSINNGTIVLSGNLTGNYFGYYGSTLIRLVGSGTQTISTTTDSFLPSVEIASTGTVNFSGIVRFIKDFTYTSGTVNAGSSSVIFGKTGHNHSATVNTGPILFNDVTFNGHGSTFNISGTINVENNFMLQDSYSGSGRINSGTILLKRNLVATLNGAYGSAQIQMIGGANSTISQDSTNALIPVGLSINKTAASVSLATDLSLMLYAQTLTVTSGNVDMAGRALTVRSNILLNGNVLTKNGGVLIVNGATVGTGALYGGTVAP